MILIHLIVGEGNVPHALRAPTERALRATLAKALPAAGPIVAVFRELPLARGFSGGRPGLASIVQVNVPVGLSRESRARLLHAVNAAYCGATGEDPKSVVINVADQDWSRANTARLFRALPPAQRAQSLVDYGAQLVGSALRAAAETR